MLRPTLLTCGLLLVTPACGPKDGSDESGADTTVTPGTASAPTTGADAGTGPGPTDATAADGSATDATDGSATATMSGTTGVDMCAPFDDVVPAPAVQISLRNEGAAPVFLIHVNFCETAPLVEIDGPDPDVAITWTHGVCEFTCGQAQQGACGCPAFCAEDSVLMIAPGGEFTFAWTGAVYTPAQMPEGCTEDESCSPDCLLAGQAVDGTYKLVARASTSAIICADPNTCTCTPNADGYCEVAASGIGAELRLAEADIKYPINTSVDLVFTDG
ncbi:MAG: hypothetical protein JNL82_32755 [Myxococcales bacterium]|nr:hypothetical protein [Myxococcales bacterium]